MSRSLSTRVGPDIISLHGVSARCRAINLHAVAAVSRKEIARIFIGPADGVVMRAAVNAQAVRVVADPRRPIEAQANEVASNPIIRRGRATDRDAVPVVSGNYIARSLR